MTPATVKKATPEELSTLRVDSWPMWEKEVSDFPWSYSEKETFYVLEGEVTVETADGPAHFGAGDLVTFSAGMDVVWHVRKPIRKRYRFG